MILQIFSGAILVRDIQYYHLNSSGSRHQLEVPDVFQSADSIIGFHQVAFQKDLPAEIFRRGDKIQGIPHLP